MGYGWKEGGEEGWWLRWSEGTNVMKTGMSRPSCNGRNGAVSL